MRQWGGGGGVQNERGVGRMEGREREWGGF